MLKILVLPGDGIGPEIMEAALPILEDLAQASGQEVQIERGLIGGAAIDEAGSPLPQATLDACQTSQAVLLGAVGGPKWDGLDPHIRPEKGLLGLRQALRTYGNLRPARTFDALIGMSPIKEDRVRGTDILVVRELLGGIYFGQRKTGTKDGLRFAYDVEYYDEAEIERIARLAFDQAQTRRKKVSLVDKANVLDSSKLWRAVVKEVHQDYPDVDLDFYYVDNAAMQVILKPRNFDVILTNNIFGDILSDELSQIVGSIGLLSSVSVGQGAYLYEPIHGSAPDIAGQDRANPLGMILSVGDLVRNSLGRPDLAQALTQAVEEVLAQGYGTHDLNPKEVLGTQALGEKVRQALAKKI